MASVGSVSLKYFTAFLLLFLTPPISIEEVYTRPLPLTSCQEDPPWVWTIRSCAMADLVYQFGRTVLEGMFPISIGELTTTKHNRGLSVFSK